MSEVPCITVVSRRRIRRRRRSGERTRMTYGPTFGAPGAGAPAPGGVAFFNGEPLLRIIATALVNLSMRGTPGDPVYPDSVQNALNQLVLLCLRRGVPPPSSVPEMAEWAVSKPLREWP